MSKQRKNSWPADRIAMAISLWKQGWSGGQIGCELGMSGSAVIGKLHRMGLTNASRNPGVAHPLHSVRPSARSKGLAPKPPIRLKPLFIPMLKIIRGQCRWPMWEDGVSGWPDFLHCGSKCSFVESYCAIHARKSLGKTVKAFDAEEVAAA